MGMAIWTFWLFSTTLGLKREEYGNEDWSFSSVDELENGHNGSRKGEDDQMSILDVLRQNAGVESDLVDHALESEFQNRYQETVADISAHWIVGTYDFLTIHHPQVDERIRSAEDRLNEAWVRGRLGQATTEEFEKALKEWAQLHYEGIELRKTQGELHGDR